MLTLSVVGEHAYIECSRLWGQTKNCKIGICCFSTKHAALRSKSKEWLSRNQNNVSEWRACSFSELTL